jgi:hypothetical protein
LITTPFHFVGVVTIGPVGGTTGRLVFSFTAFENDDNALNVALGSLALDGLAGLAAGLSGDTDGADNA